MYAAAQQSMISLQRYAALFAQPRYARAPSRFRVLGRLPIGLTGLAILLLAQTSSGSFARGGAAAACYVVGLAAVAPLLGRAIDRYGPRRILIGTGVLFPAALIALVFAVDARSAAWTLALAGGRGRELSADHGLRAHLLPPTSRRRRPARRGVLGRVGGDRADLHCRSDARRPVRRHGVRRDGSMVLRCLRRSPARCSFFAHRRCALGRSSRAHRAACSVRSPNAVSRRWSAWCCAFSSAFGFLEVGVVAYASEAAQPALAGVLLGITSAGSALGGLAYGSRGWHYPLAPPVRGGARGDGGGTRHPCPGLAAVAVRAVGRAWQALRWRPR